MTFLVKATLLTKHQGANYYYFLDIVSNLALWISFLFSIPRLTSLQKNQSLAMLAIGILLFFYTEKSIDLIQITKNQAIICMLICVSFLKLSSNIFQANQTKRPKSKLISTLFGIHFIGAMINFSSLIIMGDYLKNRDGKINILQAATLTRGFTLAAYWSPLFASMGVALTYAPHADMLSVIIFGLPIAFLGLLITSFFIVRDPLNQNTEGYPLQITLLYIPTTLAVLVLTLSYILPDLSILTIISLSSLVLPFIFLALLKSSAAAQKSYREHLSQNLTNSRGEIALFLCSGAFAAGVSVYLKSLEFSFILFSGPQEVTYILILAAILIFGAVGIHPVTSIAIFGSLLLELPLDANLLANTFLMGWVLGILSSPFSGAHLVFQARYQIPILALPRKNLPFIILLFLINSLAIIFYPFIFN
ncbi:hypothetical protein SAMN05421831_10130 [Allopseudospirillum japonicum]|uniref:Uncharacterized protein n=1 Tax=Allopseudospirillum japonicum TaxID=64971 RepID=A0A1H6Q0K7_9GAMM|nr:hypothetical protein SAMN05421831_10130 [Allopseudospirillum japonicum]